LLLLLVAVVLFVRALVPVAAASSVGEAPVWWRCEDCRRRWRSHDAGRVSSLGLRLRRAVRRRARRRGKPTPEWAAAQGTARCPSCLSRNIRPSSQQT